MQNRKLLAGSAAAVLAMSAVAAPQLANAQTDESSTDLSSQLSSEINEPGDAGISFAQNTVLNPGDETTLEPTERDDDVYITDIDTDSDLWSVTSNAENGNLHIEAPAAPDEQNPENSVEYGAHEFTLTTNEGETLTLNVKFAAPGTDDGSSIEDIPNELQNLSSTLSSS